MGSPTSDGAKTDGFASSVTAVGSLLGLSASPGPTINGAGVGAESAIHAEVVVETGSDGKSVRRMDISGTTSSTDSTGVLETLGVLEAGRSRVAQQIQGAPFTDGNATPPAGGAGRLLTNLWRGGANAAVQVATRSTSRAPEGMEAPSRRPSRSGSGARTRSSSTR